jgi:type 1 glutamine amidotransferase
MSALNKEDGRLKVAVIEGYHPFEVPQWRALFEQMEGIDSFFQSIDNWAFDCAGCKDEYDVVLFYNMNMSLEDAPFKDQLLKALDGLKHSRQGKVFLHHAILAYPELSLWSDFIGIENRSFDYHADQQYTVEIVCSQHPITKGFKSWEIEDETYTMQDTNGKSDVLLMADYSKSMKTIGWTRNVNNARVFCLQCGHDHLAWENPNYIEILQRGILWTGKKL